MELTSTPEFIISCEHAGNEVSGQYQSIFEGADKILDSHRGWDPGALELAQTISQKTNSDLFVYPYTRLLIEPNRTIGHPKLFSEFTKKLTKFQKESIIETYYHPYRNSVVNAIRKNSSQKQSTIHISVHTFTPVLGDKERNFEIGLLYDPKRIQEKNICKTLKATLNETLPDFRIRMNQPYKGASDGFTTFLRKVFDEILYSGIELEISQKLLFDNDIKWAQVCSKVGESLSVLSKRFAK